MREVSRSKAEELVQFAEVKGAIISQDEFKNFDRHVILCTEGIISLKAPKDEVSKPTIQDFHGYDNNIDVIKRKYKPIKIIGYEYGK